MSYLSAGYAFGTNESPTPDTLHQLVEDADLFDLETSELYSGSHLCLTTTLGAPTTGDAFINDEGVLSWYDGSSYTTAMPDPYTITVQNNEGSAITRGMAVIVDPTTTAPTVKVKLSNSGNFDARVLGVVKDASIANGASGEVIVRGYMGDMVVEARSTELSAGAWIRGQGVRTAYGYPEADPRSPTTYGSTFFAMSLEPVPDNSTSNFATIAAYIWR